MSSTPVATPDAPVKRLLCPAKINLHLRVGPAREDGFHPLLSWMCTVGLFDTLTLEVAGGGEGGREPRNGTNGTSDGALREAEGVDLSRARAMGPRAGEGRPSGVDPPGRETAPPGETGKLAGAAAVRPVQSGPAKTHAPGATSGIRLRLECDPPGLPCDERNLVARVAAAWRVPGAGGQAVRARLVKRIPVGAGLGGGSSDGARMILALDRLWPGGAGGQGGGDLSAFAARFGSDVPFFLSGPSSACAGRGEIVRPIPRPRPRWAVLVLPDLMMPTPDVYRRFDAMKLGRAEDVEREPDWSQWAGLEALSLLPRLANDLEPPAFSLRPELGELRAQVERVVGRTVRMSGSGSSLFTLFDDETEARAAVAKLGSTRGVAGLAGARIEAVELAPLIEDDLVNCQPCAAG